MVADKKPDKPEKGDKADKGKPVDHANDRLVHSIRYEQSTSEIKDDILQLVACLVS